MKLAKLKIKVCFFQPKRKKKNEYWKHEEQPIRLKKVQRTENNGYPEFKQNGQKRRKRKHKQKQKRKLKQNGQKRRERGKKKKKQIMNYGESVLKKVIAKIK